MGRSRFVNRILGALAAVMLAVLVFAPPAEARCWRVGHHWHCAPVRRHVVSRVYRPLYPYADYQYYRPYLYQPYPYYASYPAPGRRPDVHGCFLIEPFCW